LIIRDETPAPQPVSQKNTKQILDERYAKGEISKEEYQTMKKEIKK